MSRCSAFAASLHAVMTPQDPLIHEARRAKEVVDAALVELRKNGRLSDVSGLLGLPIAAMSSPDQARLHNILTHYYFHAGNYVRALSHAREWGLVCPHGPSPLSSELFCLMRLRRWDELVLASEKAVQRFPADSSFYSCLSRSLFEKGRLCEARQAGTKCLELKARSATGQPANLNHPIPLEFNGSERLRNVISYSLYGDSQRYLEGALRNVVDASLLYPSWTCRFYVDESVPAGVVDDLSALGADVRFVEGLPRGRFGLFWRFLVCEDSSIDRYLVRDCDSPLTIRERLAVDAWVSSAKHFHVMRDWITHTELILAGMWGGVGGSLVGMEQRFRRYVGERFWSRTIDQQFLRECIWPTVRQSVLVHDSQFDFRPCSPFPPLSQLPAGHVGMGFKKMTGRYRYTSC